MNDWRSVRSLAERECADCGHGHTHVSRAGIAHRMCREPSVLAAMGRQHVAASVARDDVCGGRLWRR